MPDCWTVRTSREKLLVSGNFFLKIYSLLEKLKVCRPVSNFMGYLGQISSFWGSVSSSIIMTMAVNGGGDGSDGGDDEDGKGGDYVMKVFMVVMVVVNTDQHVK